VLPTGVPKVSDRCVKRRNVAQTGVRQVCLRKRMWHKQVSDRCVKGRNVAQTGSQAHGRASHHINEARAITRHLPTPLMSLKSVIVRR